MPICRANEEGEMKLEFSQELLRPPTAAVFHKEGKWKETPFTFKKGLERGSLTSLGLYSRKG